MIRLLPLLFFLPFSCLAQTASDSTETYHRLQFGLAFGSMNHEVNFTPSATVEPFSGENYGVGLRYFDNKLVGFQAELSLSQAGWRENIDTSYATLYERRFSYAELLILTQLSLGNGTVQPLLQAGPYLSFPLSDAFDLPPGYVAPERTLPNYYEADFPFRINYGVQIGAGLNVELGPLTIQAEGRFLAGFSDLLKTGTTVASTSRRQGLGWHVGVFWAVAQD